MYLLARDLKNRRTLGREAPSGLLAMVIAEFFFKFHSFTLECLAFLGTWVAISFVVSSIVAIIGRRARQATL